MDLVETRYARSLCLSLNPFQPHQWPSGSALKSGMWEVPGSTPGCACQPSCSEFSVVFSETGVNMG